ncbi:hypothetical protein EV195_1128 [Tenacibaculum skagerrakense]|uniref:Uncharacterized protein n=1 Tax=Tenacibaculum skagerrakense TaxID=186571 RepID=A0A4R2NL72_9FLAO|nr:hypothetical protein [Tenacibaculum skagerrakense]TCP22359.1 hypothetical protein EV195_1128 [Tenacibaculum skagerrakense]
MKIEEAIENLYKVFSKYTTSDMHYCDCGCIDENDVKKLASKKLRELEEDDFSSYHGSALYTWGDIEHYKHFLPRILEVHNEKNGKGLIGLFEITSKLEYAEWENWDSNEIKAIKDFIFADWNSFINKQHSEIGTDDIEYYSFFFKPEDLLSIWDLTINENSLKNFVAFFYYNGTEIINKGLKIKDKIYNKEFMNLLNQPELLDKLEIEFFKADEINKDYAEKISIVTQMIEQEKTVGNNVYKK